MLRTNYTYLESIASSPTDSIAVSSLIYKPPRPRFIQTSCPYRVDIRRIAIFDRNPHAPAP